MIPAEEVLVGQQTAVEGRTSRSSGNVSFRTNEGQSRRRGLKGGRAVLFGKGPVQFLTKCCGRCRPGCRPTDRPDGLPLGGWAGGRGESRWEKLGAGLRRREAHGAHRAHDPRARAFRGSSKGLAHIGARLALAGIERASLCQLPPAGGASTTTRCRHCHTPRPSPPASPGTAASPVRWSIRRRRTVYCGVGLHGRSGKIFYKGVVRPHDIRMTCRL